MEKIYSAALDLDVYGAEEVDAHIAALQARHAEAERVTADLAMMLRRMIHRIRRTGSGTELANAAMDLLNKHGRQGSVLR